MKKILKKIFKRKRKPHKLQDHATAVKEILIDNYIKENLFDSPRYANPKKLNRFEYQVYSQNGEDGIIQEIFARIGTANRFFVEFGVSDGMECNTLFLLTLGWSGCWMDGSSQNLSFIEKKFGFLLKEKKLAVRQALVTAENIEELLGSHSVPREPDLLSIDIDGNDYWVWKAIKNYSPRVLIIEYNAIFRPPAELVVKYDAAKAWDASGHFGASLKALELLGARKGYKLVGCNFTGSNAFFVRQDLVKDKFLEPFTAENHYEPPRAFLLRKIGNRRDFGPFADVSQK